MLNVLIQNIEDDVLEFTQELFDVNMSSINLGVLIYSGFGFTATCILIFFIHVGEVKVSNF